MNEGRRDTVQSQKPVSRQEDEQDADRGCSLAVWPDCHCKLTALQAASAVTHHPRTPQAGSAPLATAGGTDNKHGLVTV